MVPNETPKPKPKTTKKTMLVRYGRMGTLGWFEHSEAEVPCTGARVIIQTDRGLELAEVVGPYNYKCGQFRTSCEQVQQYYSNHSRDVQVAVGGTFVRFATDEDMMEEKHLEASAVEEARTCQRFIREMGLPMKVIDAEHLFGGERIIIYFSSNGRVDFRELVRRLAREYQTRIELRQIGARDEARLISDLETCGQECCCRRFLKVLEPVNMRMAKLQKATLDPSKISGHCGRLKCCLRYEDDIYRDLKKKLPRKGSWVNTPDGVGRVIDGQVLTQLVVVQYANGKREALGLESVEPCPPPKEGEAPPPRLQRKREPEPVQDLMSEEGPEALTEDEEGVSTATPTPDLEEYFEDVEQEIEAIAPGSEKDAGQKPRQDAGQRPRSDQKADPKDEGQQGSRSPRKRRRGGRGRRRNKGSGSQDDSGPGGGEARGERGESGDGGNSGGSRRSGRRRGSRRRKKGNGGSSENASGGGSDGGSGGSNSSE